MQKLWLKDFDQRIAAMTANAAWDLFNARKVQQLREVERHFWVASVEVNTDLHCEVEVIISPQKINGYTCDCSREGRRMMCAHVAATLLAVRQFLEYKRAEKERQEASETNSVAARFTINTILSSVEHEQLLKFVKDYARRDKDFSLALKTWFAARADDSEVHFLQLLESVVPKNLNKKSFTERDFRRLCLVLEDLSRQMDADVAVNNAQKVFNLAAALLSKSRYLLENLSPHRGKTLQPLIEKSWHAIVQLNWDFLSPELRERIWHFMLDAVQHQRFPPHLQRQLLGWVAARKERFESIHALFHQTNMPMPQHIVALYLAALAHRGMEKVGVRILEDFARQADTIWHCLVELYYLNLNHAFVFLGEYILGNSAFEPARQRELEEMILNAAEKLKNKKLIIKYAHKKYARTGSIEVLNKLKAVTGEKTWKRELHLLLKRLKAQGEVHKTGLLLQHFGTPDQMIAFLEQEQNIHLLQKLDTQLLVHHAEWVEKSYINWLRLYLDQHFGRPANQFVRDVLNQLIQKGEQKMAINIMKDILSNFKDRQNLSEDLLGIFPKKSRRDVFLQ